MKIFINVAVFGRYDCFDRLFGVDFRYLVQIFLHSLSSVIFYGLSLIALILILLRLLKQLQLLLCLLVPVVQRIVVFELVSVDNLLTVGVSAV